MNGYGKKLYALLATKVNPQLRHLSPAVIMRSVIVMLFGTAAWRQEEARIRGWYWTVGLGILFALMFTDKENK